MRQFKPTYVTFEQAKILYDKGLTREYLGHEHASLCENYYTETGEFNGDCIEHIKKLMRKESTFLYPAPNQWETIEWLLDNHNINLSYLYDGKKWYCRISNIGDPQYFLTQSKSTRKEALSDGITYILNNLI
jgi:hypothetical protein